jgi:hypothetical protein
LLKKLKPSKFWTVAFLIYFYAAFCHDIRTLCLFFAAQLFLGGGLILAANVIAIVLPPSPAPSAIDRAA